MLTGYCVDVMYYMIIFEIFINGPFGDSPREGDVGCEEAVGERSEMGECSSWSLELEKEYCLVR